MLKKEVFLASMFILINDVDAATIFELNYSPKTFIPIILITILLIGFLFVYLKNNWSRFKIPILHKKEKEKKKEKVNFSQEFANLKKIIRNQNNSDAFYSIEKLTKEFIRSKTNIIGDFSIEEVPGERLSKSAQIFLNRLSELKYTEKEIKKEDISKLLNGLSGLLNVSYTPFNDKIKKTELHFINTAKIELRRLWKKIADKLKKPKILKPKKIRIEKELSIRDIEKLDDKLLFLIKKIENNINNPKKAIGIYEKAVKVNKLIPHSRLNSKLKELDKIILKYKIQGSAG
jgi:hypothetical protein